MSIILHVDSSYVGPKLMFETRYHLQYLELQIEFKYRFSEPPKSCQEQQEAAEHADRRVMCAEEGCDLGNVVGSFVLPFNNDSYRCRIFVSLMGILQK